MRRLYAAPLAYARAVAESRPLTGLIQDRLDRFLLARTDELATIAPELVELTEATSALTGGGKRFRARFCYWGWRAIADLEADDDPLGDAGAHRDLDAIVAIAGAIELLHAAALVHDDVIDRSDTRRGAPSAHERFAALHRGGGWARDPQRFGTASAILLGDLLLGWSADLLDEGLAVLEHRDRAAAVRAEFGTMRTEVTVGQYLDLREEHAWIAAPDAQARQRAHRVVVYKSAKYSVEAPLAIGALAAGADPHRLAALREFGVPIGVAFQLRDDLLGVYGDPAVTGKPAGDDLREGKRTVLVALAREALPSSARALVDELLGDPELTDAQVDVLRRSFVDCGAVAQVERAIEASVERARAALATARLAQAATRELGALADAVAIRTA